MSVTLYLGQNLTKEDLNVFLYDPSGNLFDPFSITYTIYRITQLPRSNTILTTANQQHYGDARDRYVDDDGCECRQNKPSCGGTGSSNSSGCNGRSSTGNQTSMQYYQDGRVPSEFSLLETVDTTPIPFGIGKYFAAWIMPIDVSIGRYKIKWSVRQYSDSTILQEVEEFDIINRADKVNYSMMNQGSSPILPDKAYGNNNLFAG